MTKTKLSLFSTIFILLIVSEFPCLGSRNDISCIPGVWPTSGSIIQFFGEYNDPATGEKGFHVGILIKSLRGKKVVASANGTVINVESSMSFGTTVVIDHGCGYISRYGNLNRIRVKEYQRVKRGDLLGCVGTTNCKNSSCLYFEIRFKDNPIDPLALIVD
jgi:murein DD-endopeptidase MepM/ murein hydrolase activator NlpD